MSAASSLAPRGDADWLHGVRFDLALILAVAALALGLGGAAVLHPPFFFYALTLDIWLLAFPHVTSTYTRILFDRASARRYWFLWTVLPVLVLAGTAAVGALGGAGGLYTAYYVGQTYHYTRQSYGIARAYRRREAAGAPAPAWLGDAVVYAFPVWGLLHRAAQGHDTFYENPLFLPLLPPWIAHTAGVATALLFLLWSYQEIRAFLSGSQRYGHALFVLTHVLITVFGYVLVREITPGWLIVNIWHNAQYLLFVWGANVTRFKGKLDPESPFLSRLCQPRNVWAYAIVCVAVGALLYSSIDFFAKPLATGVFPLLLVLHLTINFHHYLVDGIIWKSRRSTPVSSGLRLGDRFVAGIVYPENMDLLGLLRRGLVGAGCVLLASCGQDEKPEEPTGPLRCNGHEELCDRRFDEVAFPATHNSMSNGDEGWSIPNQTHAIGRQLDDGIRAFLIDTHPFEEDLYLCHQICKFGKTRLVDGLKIFRSFLEAHPSEVVTLIIEDHIPASDTERAFQESGLVPFTYTHPADAPWPTLREMITSGARLVVSAENEGPPPAWYHHVWDIASDTPYTYEDLAAIQTHGCDENRGKKENPLFLINHWISNPLASSANAKLANPYDVLSPHVKACREKHGKIPNFVAVDFYDIGDLFRVVDELNGV